LEDAQTAARVTRTEVLQHSTLRAARANHIHWRCQEIDDMHAPPDSRRGWCFMDGRPHFAGAPPPAARALLVEDSAGDAGLAIEYLSHPPVVLAAESIVCVARLRDALASLHTDTFAVVLLDLVLPDASGLEALQAVFAAAPDVPVVVVTGLEDDALAAQMLAQGAHDCVTKGPDDAAELRRAVQAAIASGRRAPCVGLLA
jgi:CheY-like chemotaxis protein